MESSAAATHDLVRNYYGQVLETKDDLKTNACCTVEAAPQHLLPLFPKVPQPILAKYYGCGFPVPAGIDGARVLDLGCGSGRDVYLAAQLVGATGRVVGIDMTDEQLAVARAHRDAFCKDNGLKAEQLEFIKGEIEDLRGAGVEPGSFDLIISNCVVNLAADKRAVLAGAFEALAEGGEFYFSDVFVDRRLPPPVRDHKVLYGECLGGALYVSDFEFLAREVGFRDPRRVSAAEIEIHDKEIAGLIGNARFVSVTYRLFKLPNLDHQCEDYGQSVTYKGGVPGSEALLWFDDHHAFEKGRPERVCGNTFDMLQARYPEAFDFHGDRSTHFGRYPDCDTFAAQQYSAAKGSSSSVSCC